MKYKDYEKNCANVTASYVQYVHLSIAAIGKFIIYLVILTMS